VRARAHRSRSIFRRRLSRAVTSGDVIVREGALPLRNVIAHKGAPCPETGPPALRNEERDAEIGRAGEKKGLRQQTRATRHVDGVFHRVRAVGNIPDLITLRDDATRVRYVRIPRRRFIEHRVR